MHELPVTESILCMVLDEAKMVQAKKVTQVDLTIGKLTGILPECVELQFKIISQHQKVKALFYGHSHAYAQERRGHIHLINLPAVGYNFNDSQPVGWVNARFSRQGVSMVLRAIGGNLLGDGKTTTIEWA